MPNHKEANRFVDMPPLPYGSIKDEVRNLPEAVYNTLDREWPKHWPVEQGPRDLLRGLVRSSQFTYRAALYLVADDPDASRRPEFAIALPPLVRGLLDTLVTLVLLFDDFRANSRWYFRAGWRELVEHRDRIATLYSDDPLWTDWLHELTVAIERMRQDFGITKAEASAAATALPRWPIPTRVPGVKDLSPERAAFAEFLIAAHYRELSQDVHLSWPGFLRRAAPLLAPKPDLNHLKQSWFQIAFTLLLAILTEIETEGRLGLAPRLTFLWGILVKYNWFAEALHEKRYADLLHNAG